MGSIPSEGVLFIGGLITFFLATVYFFFVSSRNKFRSTAYLVTATTAISYVLMLNGEYVVTTASGGVSYFTRWFFYIASCSLLMYTMAKLLKKTDEQKLQLIYLNVLVMISGGFAALMTGQIKWLLFMLSSIAFIFMLTVLFYKTKRSKEKSVVSMYVWFGWLGFPLVFLLAPEGLGLISTIWAIGLYFALDVFAKIIFYLHLYKVKLLK